MVILRGKTFTVYLKARIEKNKEEIFLALKKKPSNIRLYFNTKLLDEAGPIT